MEKESVINSTRFDFISGLNGKNVNEYYQIIGEKKETTCKFCSDMEGKIFHMSQKVEGVNFPPFHPNCGCRAVDYFNNSLYENTVLSTKQKAKENEEVDNKLKDEEIEKTISNENTYEQILNNANLLNPLASNNSDKIEESIVNWIDDLLASDEADYLLRSLDQIVKGSYTKNVTLGGTFGQIAMGFLGVDILADIRDLTYTLTHWEGTTSDVADLTLNIIGLLPLIGVLKNSKSIAKLVDASKKVDDLSAVAKASDKVFDVAEISKKSDVITSSKNIDLAQQINKFDEEILDTDYSRLHINQVKADELNGKTNITKVSDTTRAVFKGNPEYPSEYVEALATRFENGTELAKSVYKKYVPNGGVVKGRKLEVEVPAHCVDGRYVNLDISRDINNTRGNGTTWFHEHAHYIDIQNDSISNDKNFIKLIKLDAREYETISGLDLAKSRMLIGGELRHQGDVTHSIQDIFGGVIKQEYPNASWHHSSEYWNVQGDKGLASESFAHMFEASFDKNKTELMKKYFPNAWNEFEKILGGL